VIEIHGNAKSRGAGGPAEKDLGRHRLKIDPRRSKNNKSLISLTMKVSLKRLMIRNPKDFGVWSAYPSGVHSVIAELEMLPFLTFQRLTDKLNCILIFYEKEEEAP
jgi:hypothetical protein